MLDPRVPCFAFPDSIASATRFLVVSALAVVVPLTAAKAQAATVAVVSPRNTSPVWNETVSRLRGELLSVGVEAQMVGGPGRASTGDRRAWLDDLAKERGVDAVIQILGETVPSAVEVWVKSREPGRFELSRVDLGEGNDNASERLAIRALEVLRSHFLEIDLAARGQGQPSRDAPTPVVVTPSRRLGLELGAAAISSLDNVGPAILPLLRVGWELRPWLWVQAAMAGGGRSRATRPPATMLASAATSPASLTSPNVG